MLFFVFLAIFGPMLAPYSVTTQDLGARFLGPSWQHWLGTDQHGIDTLSQDQRKGFTERQKQMDLSSARGEKHIAAEYDETGRVIKSVKPINPT